MLQEEGGSSENLGGLDDEEMGETDRKIDKSELNFDLGSEKQLQNIGSSQVFDNTVTQPINNKTENEEHETS